MSDKSGRKIEAKYENPVDNALIALSECASPAFKRSNFTPNGLTSLSAVFWAGALYHLYNKETTEFTIYALLGYFFDVMNGYYARKYNMISNNGDMYDYYKDMVVAIIAVYIMYSQYDILDFPTLIIVMLALYFLMLIYLGCQEVLTDESKRSGTLTGTQSIVGKLNPDTCKERMTYLRWFGPGSMVIVLICAVLYLNGDFESIGSGISSMISDTVPGTDDLRNIYENTTSNVNMSTIHSSNPVNSGFALGTPSGMRQAEMDFINELRNFGTTTLDSYEPYSTSNMANRMIRD